jgi:hypothetical protein
MRTKNTETINSMMVEYYYSRRNDIYIMTNLEVAMLKSYLAATLK